MGDGCGGGVAHGDAAVEAEDAGLAVDGGDLDGGAAGGGADVAEAEVEGVGLDGVGAGEDEGGAGGEVVAGDEEGLERVTEGEVDERSADPAGEAPPAAEEAEPALAGAAEVGEEGESVGGGEEWAGVGAAGEEEGGEEATVAGAGGEVEKVGEAGVGDGGGAAEGGFEAGEGGGGEEAVGRSRGVDGEDADAADVAGEGRGSGLLGFVVGRVAEQELGLQNGEDLVAKLVDVHHGRDLGFWSDHGHGGNGGGWLSRRVRPEKTTTASAKVLEVWMVMAPKMAGNL